MKKKLASCVFALAMVSILSVTLLQRKKSALDAIRKAFELEPYRTTILVDTNDSVLIRHARGVGVFRFDKIEWSGAIYEYRFLASSSDSEVRERVEVSHRNLRVGTVHFDVSHPSAHYVQVGELPIPWSYHDSGKAWITYHSNLTEISVLDRQQFEVVALVKEIEGGRPTKGICK